MKKREHKSLSAVLAKYCMIGPITLWMYLLVAIPFLYIIAISFMHKGTYGGVVAGFTLQNYKDILNPLYLQTFAKSIVKRHKISPELWRKVFDKMSHKW